MVLVEEPVSCGKFLYQTEVLQERIQVGLLLLLAGRQLLLNVVFVYLRQKLVALVFLLLVDELVYDVRTGLDHVLSYLRLLLLKDS